MANNQYGRIGDVTAVAPTRSLNVAGPDVLVNRVLNVIPPPLFYQFIQQVMEDQIEADGDIPTQGIVLGSSNYWPGELRHIT